MTVQRCGSYGIIFSFWSVKPKYLCFSLDPELSEEKKGVTNDSIRMAEELTQCSTGWWYSIATFAGTTRDTFEGKSVMELRSEAHVPMAIRCIKSICSSARSSWNLYCPLARLCSSGRNECLLYRLFIELMHWMLLSF
ncbi:hypothetical protein Dsin_019434 [Dipteronia sinensis]|uniref:Uncharacterized protein n=1 Tax=Dipteronia sinensis TaxID=43782 RepID=A0AAE0A8L8_9ROSI|nr:hypothetical protein Dsin_019434 [Dipteronia sinensis]